MRDNVLLTFVGVDILFVVAGALLLVFGLMMQDDISQTPTLETAARNLLLLQCPLSGRPRTIPKFGSLLTMYSCHWKCRTSLRDLRGLYPSNCYSIIERMVEITRISRSRLCRLYIDSRFKHLV